MRFDLEQFLALTMALGTVGAVGVAVYSSQEAHAESAQVAGAEPTTEEDEPFPQAPPEPERPATPAPVSAAPPSPPPIPDFDAPDEELEAAPGPQVESMSW